MYIINLFWVFLLHKLKMLMFWCFDCVSKPNFQDNFWWIRRFSALPLNRTSKASSGLVISTSTQFITYIQSLESVLRILVWGGLHIKSYTHINTATTRIKEHKMKHLSTFNFGIQISNLLNLFQFLAIMMWNLSNEEMGLERIDKNLPKSGAHKFHRSIC